MKNYVSGTLIVAMLTLSSIIFKNKKVIGVMFPIQEETKIRASSINVSFILYIFFSKNNCSTCLEKIHTLNCLPSQIIGTGFVPENELVDDKNLCAVSGAVFPLQGCGIYKNISPGLPNHYWPLSKWGDAIHNTSHSQRKRLLGEVSKLSL